MAGLNIPKRKKMTAESLYEKATSAGDKLGRAASLGSQMLFGEDTGDGIVKDLAYGAVPGGSLYQRAMTGTMPGALDYLDVVPGVGTGLKFAMTPIAAAFSRDLLKGGKARLGKNARNLTKAQNPYIERWHRTRSKNDKGIADKGLLVGKDNPNYGKNTGDEGELPIPVAWLGTSPSEIPVLQYFAMNKPDQLSTYRVRIPRDIYYNTPRLKWDSGYRDYAGNARIVGKGESSLTGEVGRRTGNESLIDLYGASIPSQFLEKIPNDEIAKHHKHAMEMDWYRGEHGKPDQTLSEVGNDIVKNEMDNWMPASERYELFGVRQPRQLDFLIKSPTEALKRTNNKMLTEGGIPKYGYRVLQGDLPEKFAVDVGKHPRQKINFKDPNAVAYGSVSRGWQSPIGPAEDWNPRTRMFDWANYRDRIQRGFTPWAAAASSAPTTKLVDTPVGLKQIRIKSPTVNYGRVSRGMDDSRGLVGSLYAIASAESNGIQAGNTRRLHQLLAKDTDGNLASKALESIDKSKQLRVLSNLLDKTQFMFNNGAISRAGGFGEPTNLHDYYLRKMEEFASDADWIYDTSTEEGMALMEKAARDYAAGEVKELMKDNIESPRNLVRQYYDIQTTSFDNPL